MNEAWRAMIAVVTTGAASILLLLISVLNPPPRALGYLSFIGRFVTVVSALLLVVSFLLRFVLVGFIDHLLMFGVPVIGLVASIVSTRRFAFKKNVLS
jgi:hypothetical protein